MASDYQAIRTENERLYGTDVGRYGRHLLTDRYGDQTHFIYEVLQNAEDALSRRDDDPKNRAVRFDLSEGLLRISHYGRPFDTHDVEGVCGIALGTKAADVTQIGRFGIGFKSVYGFTDRPEIHSGDESFGIDHFVWPSTQRPIKRQPEETVILMPLRNAADGPIIANGLKSIRLETLLFLREIDTIEWNNPDGESGVYVRQPEPLDDGVRKVTIVGESADGTEEEGAWLVFSAPMHDEEGEQMAGYVELAFFMEDDKIVRVGQSPLVVFFPTAIETGLGFRIQGPYRTTPSRDNVPETDDWNRSCIKKTGELLVNALVWLRDREKLDVDVLQCLPLAAC